MMAEERNNRNDEEWYVLLNKRDVRGVELLFNRWYKPLVLYANLSYSYASRLARRPRYTDRDINLMNSRERVRFGKDLTDIHCIFPEGMVRSDMKGPFADTGHSKRIMP